MFFASSTFSFSVCFCTVSSNCVQLSGVVRCAFDVSHAHHHLSFFFFFFYESVYIIYILLFKIFWHSDFHFMVASGSCACWSVFMGPGEFRDRIWRQRPNASCCSSRGSSSQSHWEKARRCVCLSLTFNSIFVEIDVEIYQKSDGYRGVSSRIFDLIERRIIIIIFYQSHTLAAFFCKLLISPCTVCKYV